VHSSKVRRLAGSECVLWNEELLEHVQVHDTANGHLHGEEGAVHFSLLRAQNTFFLAVTNMFQGDTWIFSVPDPAIVGIDFTTDMKRSLIAENYGVQKSLIGL
jgi:hypothetical protein